jgi:hypothetical protein
MHRFDATCHWCGVLPTASWRSTAVWRSAAAVLLSVTVAGAAWRYGPPLRVDLMQRLNAESLAMRQVATKERRAASPGGPAGGPLASPTVSLPATAGLPASPALDSVTWTPAIARTWVNVRNDASRGGDVVGVIQPAARAMLGTDRAGWRQVRSPDIIGWVDPRLFKPDSLRIRGE